MCDTDKLSIDFDPSLSRPAVNKENVGGKMLPLVLQVTVLHFLSSFLVRNQSR